MTNTSLYHPKNTDLSEIDTICIGSGRFLRSVLVPPLNEGKLKPAIFQTRGTSFLNYCKNKEHNSDNLLSYEVDTVQYDGKVKTDILTCYAAGTLGTDDGKQSLFRLLEQMKCLKVIGIGVTESGIQPGSKALVHLTDILRKCHSLMNSKNESKPTLTCPNPNGRISIINTDNIPHNGDLIQKYVLNIAKSQNTQYKNGKSFLSFLQKDGQVTFHNSMVDRITSERPDSNGMVPRCEPTPDKAIVIEDLNHDLPSSLCTEIMKKTYGVVVRTKPNQLEADIALKLRVANGTHTGVAHAMALSSLLLTDVLSDTKSKHVKTLITYLDSFFYSQILPGAEIDYGTEETRAVYDDWKRRLCHAHFGLSTFFITQNGAAKGGIRIAPTIRGLFHANKDVTMSTIFSLAAILRFITPSHLSSVDPKDSKYVGWLDSSKFCADLISNETTLHYESSIMYADGLRYHLEEGWYEFKCDCMVQMDTNSHPLSLPKMLRYFVEYTSQESCGFEDIIRGYLISETGGNMKDLFENPSTTARFENVVKAVAHVYARMISGDKVLDILKEMEDGFGIYDMNRLNTPCYCILNSQTLSYEHGVKRLTRNYNSNQNMKPIHYRLPTIPDHSHLMECKLDRNHNSTLAIVIDEVASASVIDLHTHLLPPTHGSLCLWGIDELLTYHYLVAEYFMTAPKTITPTIFYAKSKQIQADLIWKALFVDRSPISEACRGVITTLQTLGLSQEIQDRDLNGIRDFYRSFRNDGLAGSERFSDLVYNVSGVKYAIMTNIPFDINEAQHWRPQKKEYSNNYKSALRVDPLLSGDREVVENALKISGYETSLNGARQYLLDWIDTINPEYMMASTPHNFDWPLNEKGPLSKVEKKGLNEEAMKVPFAFVDQLSMGGTNSINCDGDDDEIASIIDEKSDLLSDVLMKVCEERDIPIALKIGAHRGVNPKLLSAGDGVVAFADGNVLARLCSRFPKVRFLATFLSRNNQHEACVLASKFRNLHIYGCWWYCNNPSIIKEITEMRLEMLGTAFTAQHSDARVLDQLIYKWSHSRKIIAHALAEQYMKIIESGWVVTRKEVRRDVQKLFGQSYLDFMKKSLA